MTGHVGKQDRDTKVKQETHQNKTRKQTDHYSTPPTLKGRLPGDPRHAKKKVIPNRVGGVDPGGKNPKKILEACNGLQKSQTQIGWVGGCQVERIKKKIWRPAILDSQAA